METLKWLYNKTWRAGLVLLITFIALYIISFFIPKEIKDKVKNALRFGFDFLPDPIDMNKKNAGGPQFLKEPNFEDEGITKESMYKYVSAMNVGQNGVLKENSLIYGFIRNDFFEKESSSFQIIVRSKSGKYLGGAVAYAQPGATNPNYSRFIARVPYFFAEPQDCVLVFRREERTNKFADITELSLPMFCK